MTTSTSARTRGLSRRPAVRRLAVLALLAGPIAAVPVLMTGHAVAAPGERTAAPATQLVRSPRAAVTPCINGGQVEVLSLNGPAGTATVEELPIPSAATPSPAPVGTGCQTISLVAYKTPGLPIGSDAQYPQQLVATVSAELTEPGVPVTLTLPAAPSACDSQVDVIYGLSQSGQSTIQTVLNSAYYSANGLLLPGGHADFAPAVCTTPTSPTTTPPTTPTTPTSPTTTPPTTPTTPTSPTTTPPTTPTTPTSPTTTPPTTPTTPTTPTSSTTTPPVSTSSTSVLPTSTSRPPTSTSSAPTSSKSVVVLPTSTSRAPEPINGGGSLPYTGSNIPVRAGVMSGFALLSLGGALVLFAGRPTRRRRAH